MGTVGATAVGTGGAKAAGRGAIATLTRREGSMELRQLEVFVRVAALKSTTRASEELYLTQPAVSRSLAALERELGAALFDRFARSMELTSAGRALLDHA